MLSKVIIESGTHITVLSFIMKIVTSSILFLLNNSNHTFYFIQIVLQGHATRVTAKSQQSGEKAFRCQYDGCGKLYTTAHHLKVHIREMSYLDMRIPQTLNTNMMYCSIQTIFSHLTRC
jgi:hypothetical protein